MTTPGAILLVDPWAAFVNDHQRQSFETELVREMSPGHVLFGRSVRAIGHREDRDDVLFALNGGGWAIVHLTFSSSSSDRDWPRSALLATPDEVQARIDADARDFA